ncbi:hypothetical protein QTG56_23655 (plasmid) [Rossellomorea sp. AcN35-11]|nr:hypothetical protein [Rossellomorea aquimaris]WJV32359.1 hypothetical protein QTG56_23655 [Rossellomorea sp. AcN35-11]
MLVTKESDRTYSGKVSDYKQKLNIMQMESDQLKRTYEKDSKIIKLESERKALLAFLGNGSDLISSFLKFQQKFNALQEENGRLKDDKQASREKVIALSKDLEKLSKVHEIQLRTKDVTISELEEQYDLKILNSRFKELEEQSKRTELELTNKISDLLGQKSEIENQLKTAVVDNINSLKREEEAVIELDQEKAKSTNLTLEYEGLLEQVNQLEKYKEIGSKSECLAKEVKQLEREHRELTGEHHSLSKRFELLDEEHSNLKSDLEFLVKQIKINETKYNNLLNRYNALKDSKLGKLTLKYWKLSKRWAKGRQR